MTGDPDDMPESALQLPGEGLSKEYRDRAEEMGASDVVDFDRLVNWIQSELQIQSARVTFPRPPMAHFHVTLDGKEYIIAIVPTDLATL